MVAPQTCPHRNPQYFEYVTLHEECDRERRIIQKRETNVADGIRAANQLTLQWGDYPGLSR